jgi:hypothetical protein
MKFRKLTGRETGYRLHGEHRPTKVSKLVEKGQHQFINPLELDLVNEQAFYVSSHSDLSSLNDFEVKRYKDKLDDVRADVMYMNRLKCYIVELHKAFGGALSFFGNLGLLRCHEDHFCEDGKINLPTIDNDMMEFTSKRGGIIHVYRPQDTYCLGWIAYGDYSKTKTGKNKYVLYSRHITNNKSIPENKIYHMAFYGERRLAVSRASAEFRPFTEAQSLTQVIDDAGYRANQHRRDRAINKDEKLESVRELIGSADSKLAKELYNLLDTGHEFLSSVVEQRVRELRDVYKHYEEIRRKTYDMYAVRVYEDRHGVQRYSLHRIVNATDYEREIWELTDDDNRPMTFTNDNISKSLRGSLSVLSMLKVGDNVEDVGFRHDEDLYFIYINDEEKGNE